MASRLFPAEPRPLRGRRAIKMALRAAHTLCAGMLVGAYAFDAPSRPGWLAAAIATGLLILLLDLHESGAFLLQVRGLVVVVKLAALACLPWFAPHEAWVLGGLVLLSVLSSHAPARVRYRVLLGGGRIRGADSHG